MTKQSLAIVMAALVLGPLAVVDTVHAQRIDYPQAPQKPERLMDLQAPVRPEHQAGSVIAQGRPLDYPQAPQRPTRTMDDPQAPARPDLHPGLVDLG